MAGTSSTPTPSIRTSSSTWASEVSPSMRVKNSTPISPGQQHGAVRAQRELGSRAQASARPAARADPAGQVPGHARQRRGVRLEADDQDHGQRDQPEAGAAGGRNGQVGFNHAGRRPHSRTRGFRGPQGRWRRAGRRSARCAWPKAKTSTSSRARTKAARLSRWRLIDRVDSGLCWGPVCSFLVSASKAGWPAIFGNGRLRQPSARLRFAVVRGRTAVHCHPVTAEDHPCAQTQAEPPPCVALALAVILGGCGGTTPAPGEGTAAKRPAIDAPDDVAARERWSAGVARMAARRDDCRLDADPVAPGGNFVVSLTDSVRPRLAPVPRNRAERLVFSQLYETLVRIDCEGAASPGLAVHWSCGADSTVWVFTLREDARTWDGERLTAVDVWRSWQENCAAPVDDGASPWQWFDPRTGSVSVLDARRLTVRLPEPQRLFPLLLAHPATAVAVRKPGLGLARRQRALPSDARRRRAAAGADLPPPSGAPAGARLGDSRLPRHARARSVRGGHRRRRRAGRPAVDARPRGRAPVRGACRTGACNRCRGTASTCWSARRPSIARRPTLWFAAADGTGSRIRRATGLGPRTGRR